MYFNFENPKYLILLFVIPVLIFFHFYSLKNARGKSLKFANFEAIARIKGIDLYSRSIMPLILNIVIVVCLVFALSGFTLYVERNVSSFAFVITIDNSQSMGATDILPDRLSAAKQNINNFVDSLPPNPRIGVVSFSDTAYIETELSSNKDKLKNSVNNIKLSDKGGTDIYEAVVTSYSLLKDSGENIAIILISDGQINVGNIQEVIDFAVDKSIIIHTFGIGTEAGGKTIYGMSKIDEDSLKGIAYNTKGEFFNINSVDDMEESFSKVVPLTKKTEPVNLSYIFIIIATLLFILNYLLTDYNRIKI